MIKWITIVYCYNKGIISLLTEDEVRVGEQVKFVIASSRSVVPKSESYVRIKIWDILVFGS
jgi:hypothetical protein